MCLRLRALASRASTASTKPSWSPLRSRAPPSPQASLPGYDPLVMSKPYLLRDAMEFVPAVIILDRMGVTSATPVPEQVISLDELVQLL